MEHSVIHLFYLLQLVVEVRLLCNNRISSISSPALLLMCFFHQILSLLALVVICICISHSLDRNYPSSCQSSAFHQEIIHLLSGISHDGLFSSPISPINQQDFTHQQSHSYSQSFALTGKSVKGLPGLPDDPIEEEDDVAASGIDGSRKNINNAISFFPHYHSSQLHQTTVLGMDPIECSMESAKVSVCLSEKRELTKQDSQNHYDCALQVTNEDEWEWMKEDGETKLHDNSGYELFKEGLEEESAFLAFIEHGEFDYENTSFSNKRIRIETEIGGESERESSNSESITNALSPSTRPVIQTAHSFRIVPNTIEINSVPRSKHHSHIYQVRDI